MHSLYIKSTYVGVLSLHIFSVASDISKFPSSPVSGPSFLRHDIVLHPRPLHQDRRLPVVTLALLYVAVLVRLA